MGIPTPVVTVDYGKPLSPKAKRVISLVLGILVFVLIPSKILADGITDVMRSSGFAGNMEMLSKFDFLGMFLSFILTACGVIGLVIIFGTVAINYVYLFGRPLFDTIAEYQEADKGSGFLGLFGTVKDVFKGNRGTGGNAVFGLAASLMPNVRAWSGYNPERMGAGLDQEDTPWSYTLKAAPQVIIGSIIFILCFQGTPAKAAATIGEAVATLADHAVETDLAAMADKWASEGKGYTFTIGRAGTPEAKLADRIAKKLYMVTLKETGATDSRDKQIIGNNAENIVYKNLFGGKTDNLEMLKAINSMLKDGSGLTADQKFVEIQAKDVSSVKLEVEVNTNSNRMPGEINRTYGNASTLPISELLKGSSIANTETRKLYIHIFLIKGKTTSTEFFVTAKTGSANQ